MMRAAILVLACGLPFLPAGCASSPEQDAAAYDRRLPRLLSALQARGDADSLAAAAIIRLGDDMGEGLSLVQRASDAAPDRADLAWLALSMCLHESACDPQPWELRLRTLDPENGAAWLGTITRASKARQPEQVLLGLRGMAASGQFRTYWIPLQRRLIPAVAGKEQLSLADATEVVIGALAAQSLPPYGPIRRSCEDDSLRNPGMLEACRGAAHAMERGDSVITQLSGIHMQTLLWPAASPQAQAALATRRVMRYRMSVLAQIELSKSGGGYYENYLNEIGSHTTEQEYLSARILKAGKSAEPPADWVEPDEPSRAAVSSGR